MAEPGSRGWPIAIAVALASMIGASLAFLAIAIQNPDAEVVGDAYEAGLAYNEELALRRRAAEHGLEIALVASPSRDGVQVQASVRDRRGQPLRPDSVSVRRIRPSQGGYDTDFALEPGTDGFEGGIPLPLAGRWRLEATLEIGGDSYWTHREVWR